jgi:hypothetical protein
MLLFYGHLNWLIAVVFTYFIGYSLFAFVFLVWSTLVVVFLFIVILMLLLLMLLLFHCC